APHRDAPAGRSGGVPRPASPGGPGAGRDRAGAARAARAPGRSFGAGPGAAGWRRFGGGARREALSGRRRAARAAGPGAIGAPRRKLWTLGAPAAQPAGRGGRVHAAQADADRGQADGGGARVGARRPAGARARQAAVGRGARVALPAPGQLAARARSRPGRRGGEGAGAARARPAARLQAGGVPPAARRAGPCREGAGLRRAARVLEVLDVGVGVFSEPVGGLDPVLESVEPSLLALASSDDAARWEEITRELSARVSAARAEVGRGYDPLLDLRSCDPAVVRSLADRGGERIGGRIPAGADAESEERSVA